MNKNLKKVISTIAALAVSASSMVAFATGYPDVPETATYAQAVKELSALNVISGYEDGTFLPDKNVTRAEITKMIVTSLGSATLSAANAAAGKDTKFADVPGSHWASGFVSTATANANSNNGFINGYDETTFGPDDNVTYAQAIKMLVSALGYQTYAENNGGWPNGYLNYGYTLEIADGVTGVSNDTQVTRAQVAQMIDNAIKAPICVIDGYETQWNGTQTPNFVIKDETSTTKKNSWQCLLNYSHDAYVVNGRVVATQAQGGVKADEVKIDIEKSNNYDGYQVVPYYNSDNELVAGIANQVAYIGESDADDYLFSYAEMVLQLNDDDEITILSISPVGAESKSVTFAAEDYAAEKSTYDATNGYVMAVYESANSTATKKYEVDASTKMYVNGVDMGLLSANVATFVGNNVTGTVTLIDSPEAGKASVDGIYDYAMVSYYKDAVVDSVVGDEEQATIYFSEIELGLEATMDVDYTDDDKMYSFTLTDGTELTALDLQENDVLSIAYSHKTGSDFSNSDSYEVLVSRDTVEGKVASADINQDDSTKSEFTINGEAYGLAAPKTGLVKDSEIKVSYEYVLYLDAFGKIAKMEETATSNKLAILDNVYTANGDQMYVTLIMPDGTKESYTVKDANDHSDYADACYVDPDATTKVKLPIQKRVWSYSVSSSTGNVTLKTNYPAQFSAPAASGTPDVATAATYKASSNKIGSIRINDALTSIIDAAEYATENEVGAMTTDGLEDDADYVAYGFNKLSDNSYQFVIVTDGTSGSFTYKTEFVVYSRSYTKEVDGEDKVAYLVYDGEKNAEGENVPVEVVLDSEGVDKDGLVEGTPVILKKNSAGYVTEVINLFVLDTSSDSDNDNVTLAEGYSAFATAVRNGMVAQDLSKVLNVTELDDKMKKSSSSYQSDWVFGMVYDKSSNSLTLATVADEYTTENVTYKNAAGEDVTDTYNVVTNIDNLKEYDVDADAKVMTYSYKERAGKGARVANSILSTVLRMNMSTAFVDDDDTKFAWDHSSVKANENATFGRTSFVLAKTIDGDIVEAYVIIPSSSK